MCAECGGSFTAQAIVLAGGRPLRGAKPPEVCRPCKAAAEARAKEEAAEAARRERANPDNPQYIDRLRAAGINDPALWRCTMENFNRKAHPSAFHAARRFVHGVLSGTLDAPRWVLFTGPTGTGKSHLLIAIDRALFVAGYPGVILDVAPSFVRRVQQAYSTGRSDVLVEERIRANVWLCDDLGRGKQTDDVVRIIGQEIGCERAGQPTVWSSNYTAEGLQKRHDDYETLASRMGAGVCNKVVMGGQDWREKPAA